MEGLIIEILIMKGKQLKMLLRLKHNFCHNSYFTCETKKKTKTRQKGQLCVEQFCHIGMIVKKKTTVQCA